MISVGFRSMVSPGLLCFFDSNHFPKSTNIFVDTTKYFVYDAERLT